MTTFESKQRKAMTIGQGELFSLIGLSPQDASEEQLADICRIDQHPRFDKLGAATRLGKELHPAYGKDNVPLTDPTRKA